MDDQNKNLILATVLSFLVILVWFVLFPPPTPEPAPLDGTGVSDLTAPTAGATATTPSAGAVANTA
jgi:YidC/Oxa1 family membrane protein insertase